jgi:cytochrome c-type biogenesis protein CcmH/NrfG
MPEVITAWQYGAKQLARGDIATGLAVLQNVVAHAPQDVAKRRALREIEREIRQQHAPEWSLAEPELTEVWLEIRSAKRHRAGEFIEWDGIDRAAERGLAVNPWDADLHLELGHACAARGYREAACFAYQCALEASPDRDEIKEHLAKLDQ